MTKTRAQQYHENERDKWMRVAKRQWILHHHRSMATIAVAIARHHNHQAIHVARLTRARMEQNAR